MVARRRGWGGDPPLSDAEARARIVAAAADLMATRPSALLLADVAGSLSVARQTVYKYFASADELVTAAATADIEGIIDQVAGRAHAAGGPVEAVVDSMLAAIDLVRASAVLDHAFRYEEHAHLAVRVVSPDARDHCVAVLRQTGVAWSAIGYTTDDLADIAELSLRILQSLLLTPELDVASTADLRRRLTRWVGPMIEGLAHDRTGTRPRRGHIETG